MLEWQSYDHFRCKTLKMAKFIFVLIVFWNYYFTKVELMAVLLVNWLILQDLNSVSSVMQYLITHFNDFQLACLGSFFLHESVFFLSGLPFIWFERAGWLSKYKIQVSLLFGMTSFIRRLFHDMLIGRL